MKIAIGADHRGYELKGRIKKVLQEEGHSVTDLGTDSPDSADYPDFAIPVAEMVAAGEVQRGILICGSGIGMSIAANKVAGVRAALCRSVEDAEMTRCHNDSNVLALSEQSGDNPRIMELVLTWINTPFEGGRHLRRINKIADYEASHS
ncbi:MAG: ribose 5-phosphate isomerase B [Candidatus Latescibacteria bacterium]|nr:ribose 5-phosphate isomerase B [bacterium]MBD3425015.1 ribose 5-phosphate isomerase B [Candidatus Latescibacterota bacterium]